MGLLQRIFGNKQSAQSDAGRIYKHLMEQSRKPSLFGEGRLPDNYDGRIEALTLHLAIFINALRNHGENGQRLSQSLFDTMVDDFNVALREEGLTDTGIKHRIKPMVGMFYARLKGYSENFTNVDGLSSHLDEGATADGDSKFKASLTNYIGALYAEVGTKSLAELSQMKLDFPELT